MQTSQIQNVRWLLIFATFCAAAAPGASGMQNAGNRSETHQARRGAGTKHLRPLPGSNGDSTAVKPAKISFDSGKLSVTADNSELSQILKSVATITGMAIDGSVTETRVFGVYGPYRPREVLKELLTGSGYNFIMTGDTPDGSPAKLLLTPRGETSPVAAVAIPAAADSPAGQGAGTPPNGQQVAPVSTEDLSVGLEERMQQKLRRLEQMRDLTPQSSTPE